MTLSISDDEVANSCVMHHQIEAKVASSTLASLIACYAEQVGGFSAYTGGSTNGSSRDQADGDLEQHLQPLSNEFVSRSVAALVPL